jgi:hypothetical protein
MNSLRSKKSHINRYGMLTPGSSKALGLLRNRPSQTDRTPLIRAQTFADSGTYAKGMNRLLTAFRIAYDDLSIFTRVNFTRGLDYEAGNPAESSFRRLCSPLRCCFIFLDRITGCQPLRHVAPDTFSFSDNPLLIRGKTLCQTNRANWVWAI